MKNEVLVRAITEIDEELIVSAHRSESSKRKSIKYFSALAAACLLLICGVVFLFHKNNSRPEIVFGEPAAAVPIGVISYDLRDTSQSGVTSQSNIKVPFEIVSKRDMTVTAVDGEISVYSAETNKLIYVGQLYKANEPVTVEWTIEDPDTEKTYRITVNNKEKVYMLRYDETEEKWSITETEE